jgi:hypothetical protein
MYSKTLRQEREGREQKRTSASSVYRAPEPELPRASLKTPSASEFVGNLSGNIDVVGRRFMAFQAILSMSLSCEHDGILGLTSKP